jgi:hypothetical protein
VQGPTRGGNHPGEGDPHDEVRKMEFLVSPPGVLIVTLVIFLLPVFEAREGEVDRSQAWSFMLFFVVTFMIWCFTPVYGLIPLLQYLGVLELKGWPEFFFFDPLSPLSNAWLLLMNANSLYYMVRTTKLLLRMKRAGSTG